jgi:MSHA biogenesis protein MshE
LKILRSILSLPHGLLLITGPTGSGKTTTLYGALSELNKASVNIITVEDPVEYGLSRINQVQVQSAIGFTFARALRAILRQDPDIIMVGELRDEETVDIALRSAMTGHFVLSTLHTNDAISSALRLLDMGAEGYLIASVLRGIIAQRLVRRICRNCIHDTELSSQENIWVNAVGGSFYSVLKFKQGAGCSYCHHTGYKGQIGVFEILELTPPLVDALRINDATSFSMLAKKQATFRPLVLSGLDLAASGVTTISEVIRIAGENMQETKVDVTSHKPVAAE